VKISKPGLYDLPADVYHRDPVEGGSLSSSGARKLINTCPALFDYERRNPPLPTDEFTFGHGVHKLVLGAGADIVTVDAKDWKTNAAKEAKAGALAAGKIPLLTKEHDKAKAMAAVVRDHPLAAKLLASGEAERALVWQDEETGVWCRALVDWLGRFPVDYKTCVSAAPAKIDKAMYEYGYHLQADFYLDGIKALGLRSKPKFAFVFQEKTPPYLVTVGTPNHLALEAGAHYNRQARLLYAECVAAGRWPGYSDDIVLMELPAYAQNRFFEESGR
jgi:hypothetical protein